MRRPARRPPALDGARERRAVPAPRASTSPTASIASQRARTSSPARRSYPPHRVLSFGRSDAAEGSNAVRGSPDLRHRRAPNRAASRHARRRGARIARGAGPAPRTASCRTVMNSHRTLAALRVLPDGRRTALAEPLRRGEPDARLEHRRRREEASLLIRVDGSVQERQAQRRPRARLRFEGEHVGARILGGGALRPRQDPRKSGALVSRQIVVANRAAADSAAHASTSPPAIASPGMTMAVARSISKLTRVIARSTRRSACARRGARATSSCAGLRQDPISVGCTSVAVNWSACACRVPGTGVRYTTVYAPTRVSRELHDAPVHPAQEPSAALQRPRAAPLHGVGDHRVERRPRGTLGDGPQDAHGHGRPGGASSPAMIMTKAPCLRAAASAPVT